MTLDADAVCADILGILRTSVNADGGWGYSTRKTSRLEPTCWAILALRGAGDGPGDEARVDAALALVASWQRAGGLLSDTPSAPTNLAFNGLAAIVAQNALGAGRADGGSLKLLVGTLLAGISATGGVRLKQSAANRQDNHLVGWAWNEGTFSWAEPTSWCLLALKKARNLPGVVSAADRIDEAERLLVDRCCLSGGWNVGSSNVLGKELSPYVPTTAVGLLALQDRTALPEVVRSLAWLGGNWPRERSALALSMALIALRMHGRAVDEVERTIRAHVADSGLQGNLCSMALMLYALTGPRHEHSALRV
jgi:hypothetical protein